MLFRGINKSLTLDVVHYEFPDSPPSEPHDYNFDSNWLVVSGAYTENGETRSAENPCLLTFELSELYEGLGKLKNTGSYVSAFIEPYLQITAAKNEEQYSLDVEFAFYSGGEWEFRSVCSEFSEKEFDALLNELKELVDRYPER